MELIFAALLHDIGKPSTLTCIDRIRFNGHAKVGAEIVKKILEKFKFSKESTNKIVWLVANHMRFHLVKKMKQSNLKKMIANDFADCKSANRNLDNYNYLLQCKNTLLPDKKLPSPFITGHNLIKMGFTPGPIFKEILKKIYEKQLDGKIINAEDAISYVKSTYLNEL